MRYQITSIAHTHPLRILIILTFAALSLSPHRAYAQLSTADLREKFQNPPADARPLMRWWWFGPAVTKPELQKELETMASAGIGGVEIQPVYPLMLDDESKGIKNLPYLSPEFLDDVAFANRTARALGLRVDITLGSGWPYGGPHTPLALAAGCLRIVTVPINGPTITPPTLEPGDTFIAAFAAVGSGQTFDPATAQPIDLTTGQIPTLRTPNPILQPTSTDPERRVPHPIRALGELGGSPQSTPQPPTPRVALFFISSHTHQTVKRAAYGAEGLVLDHFSRPAIDAHIADVATPLLNAFADQPPYSVFSDSLEVYGSDWTPNLPAEFLKRRGYDLIPHLPELLAGGSPQADAVRHDWAVTLSDLIRENYLAPLTRFAESHHTQFRSQTYGQPAVTLADQAIPNLPEGEGPQWREFSYTRWATSAAHLYHRNVVSAETFTWLHSPAFRATPLDMKVEADRMFLLGVNQIVGHGWPYSPPAAGEPGQALYAAAVFNNHNPWFAVMPDIARYLQRISWLLRQGEPANDVAILLPEDDAQAAFSPGHDSVTDEIHKRITPELVSTILDAGYNLDFIDAPTIDKLANIPYPILVIPPTTRIPLATYNKIAAYAASGGHVIGILGTLPSLAPGLAEQADSPSIAALTQQLFRPGHGAVVNNSNPAPLAFSLGSTSVLPWALHQVLAPDVVLTPATPGIGFIHRKLPDSDIYFVVNSTNQPFSGTIQFRSKHTFLEAWNPDSASILSRSKANTSTLSLAAYESRIFVLSDADPLIAADIAPNPASESKTIDLSTGWQIRFPGTPHPTPDTRYPTPETPIYPLTSWTNLPNRQYFSGEAIYTRTFTLDPDPAIDHSHSDVFLDFGPGTPTTDTRPPNASGIHALLDPPIREAATIFVNGQPLGSLWHPPYQLNITTALHPGQNTIEVHVYSTAINLLASQPPRDYTALRARFGHRFDPQDMDNLQPIPSGLLGPITLDILTPP